MVEGPIVWDLLSNFVNRWLRQAGSLHHRKLRKLAQVRSRIVPPQQPCPAGSCSVSVSWAVSSL